MLQDNLMSNRVKRFDLQKRKKKKAESRLIFSNLSLKAFDRVPLEGA